MSQQRNIAIMIFDEVEVLDFAGPFEVFNITGELNPELNLNVFTIAETSSPVKSRGKLNINPNYSMFSTPPLDLLLVPGGRGSRALLEKPLVLNWLREQKNHVDYLLSVCTGSLVLGKAGLLNGLQATTHHGAFDELRAVVSHDTEIVTDERYVVNADAHIITSGGIAAGIDMSLYVVQQLFGNEVLKTTLTEMEYHWTPETTLHWRDSVAGL